MANDDSNKMKADGKRSIGVRGLPKMPLSKVLDLGKAVFELGDEGANPVPRALALDHIGRAATGGASNTLVGTSNSYGITKISDEKLTLTGLGRVIVSDKSTPTEKKQAIYDLLAQHNIFGDLASRYTDKPLPPDKAIHLHLTQNHKMSPQDAQAYWEITKANLKDHGLLNELANGSRMFAPRPTASKEKIPPTSEAGEQKTVDENIFNIPESVGQNAQLSPNSKGRTETVPEFHFNIQIHLPENSSPETYDAIFKSIAVHLLGREE